ncbi:MAG: hypothetical protein IPK86_00405 [Neisseriales bacterium]|nr:MAG: hypothetical protein IPK86_00405 [Neisseriales bacterium]
MKFALCRLALNQEDIKKLFCHDDWNWMRTQEILLSKLLKHFFVFKDELISYNKTLYEYQPILTIYQDTSRDLNDWIADIYN